MLSENNTSYPSYDLAVIGGGINGAAIARDAALRGMSVILLEKDDFGSGASSKSSKLAHGGIRYLEHLHFALVKESLHERDLLLKNAPHLVKPLPFVYPVYAKDPHSLWKVRLGLHVYDFLSGNSSLPHHKKMVSSEIVKTFSGMKSEGLKGGCHYFDAQMLDNRIVIENILDAEKNGAIVKNYAEVTQLLFSNHKVSGLIYKSDGKEYQIHARCVLNATGAWSNGVTALEKNVSHPQVSPTKGIHILLPLIQKDTALILHAPQDGRIFFIIPWEGVSLVGTTDTYYGGDPDNVSVDPNDITYLLEAVNYYFPESHFKENSILGSFAGLRPLVDTSKPSNPSSISREHCIEVSNGGLITILGGKYTTYRKIAEEAVDIVLSGFPDKKKYAPCTTKKIPLPGAQGSLDDVFQSCLAFGLPSDLSEHLVHHYGVFALKILDVLRAHPDKNVPISKNRLHLLAEETYAIQYEHVKKREDFLCRRTNLGFYT